jgi:hypothetical protein
MFFCPSSQFDGQMEASGNAGLQCHHGHGQEERDFIWSEDMVQSGVEWIMRSSYGAGCSGANGGTCVNQFMMPFPLKIICKLLLLSRYDWIFGLLLMLDVWVPDTLM